MSRVRVAILGAGPAGVGAAWRLRVASKAEVLLLEQQHDVGGNAGSFELAGIPVDYGSHRLHPACEPRILHDLHTLLGRDLLDRPRHGRIRLRGRWIHFPLKPLDLFRRLPPSFTFGVLRDAFAKPFSKPKDGSDETFETVLRRGLGSTICRAFYFPYAQKLWGLDPAQLSSIQAARRVSAGSLGKMVRKVLAAVPGLRPAQAGRFYYPRQGYGQISRAMASTARDLGAEIHLNARVTRVTLGAPHRVETQQDSRIQTWEADSIWSTLPIPVFARMIQPAAPQCVIQAADRIRYRGMVLVYLVLAQGRFSPFDAHYFPEAQISLSRLSEPKNYAGRHDPQDRTVLCAELPCDVGSELWHAADRDLVDRVREGLAACDLPIRSTITTWTTRRLPHAYPVYARGFDRCFSVLDEWMEGLPRVLTFGRQGLFAHDNTHHALTMAYAAVDCLEPCGTFDLRRWKQHRRQFDAHVVED